MGTKLFEICRAWVVFEGESIDENGVECEDKALYQDWVVRTTVSGVQCKQADNRGYIYRVGKGLRIANAASEDYKRLDTALEIRKGFRENGMVEWGIWKEDELLYAFIGLPLGVVRLPKAPFLPMDSGYDLIPELFLCLQEGASLKKRLIDESLKKQLLWQYTITPEELWENLLRKNRLVGWTNCAAGEELVWAQRALAGMVTAPVMEAQRNYLDGTSAWKKWVLLPPGEKDEVRIVEFREEWNWPRVHIFETGTVEAILWLRELVLFLCPRAGAQVAYGYFAAQIEEEGANVHRGRYVYGKKSGRVR